MSVAMLPLALGASAGATALSVSQQVGAAKMAEKQGELAAKMEDVAAMQRETDRKLDLARAISSTRAAASGAGILANVGSPLAVVEQQIQQEKIDTERDKFNAKIEAQSARFRGAAQAGQLRGQAGISLLRGAGDFASAMPPKKPEGAIK